nr:hypothetical protein [Tanacetum cinerariifolium]
CYGAWVFEFRWEKSETKEGANTDVADANNEKEHVDYIEGASGTQSYGNIGQGVTPKPIGTTAESTDFVLINVTDAPTTELNNTASILSGPTSYAKLVRTLITPAGNGADVAVSCYGAGVFEFRWENSETIEGVNTDVADANNKKEHVDYIEGASGTQSYGNIGQGVTPKPIAGNEADGRSSYAREIIELRANFKLKATIVVDMPNLVGAGEKKTVKKPSQTSRGVSVGLKIGFKPQKEYRPVPKKPNVISSGNKKKGIEPTIEVGNLNPFDVLNLVDNDVDFGTNGGTTNLKINGAISIGSSFMNINNNGEFASNTPISKKIDKIKRQIYDGKLRLLDNDGNPLVPMGIVESDSEVEVVFDETTNLRILMSG